MGFQSVLWYHVANCSQIVAESILGSMSFDEPYMSSEAIQTSHPAFSSSLEGVGTFFNTSEIIDWVSFNLRRFLGDLLINVDAFLGSMGGFCARISQHYRLILGHDQPESFG